MVIIIINTCKSRSEFPLLFPRRDTNTVFRATVGEVIQTLAKPHIVVQEVIGWEHSIACTKFLRYEILVSITSQDSKGMRLNFIGILNGSLKHTSCIEVIAFRSITSCTITCYRVRRQIFTSRLVPKLIRTECANTKTSNRFDSSTDRAQECLVTTLIGSLHYDSNRVRETRFIKVLIVTTIFEIVRIIWSGINRHCWIELHCLLISLVRNP